jgi:DNA/RNA-binding domain of Phe-tRNA-synthetase-like protein
MVEVPIQQGKVAQALRSEFPGLRLRYVVLPAGRGRSPAGVKQRLRYMSDRFHGQRALSVRQEPITSAYRVFFRQIGLDPDETRTPVEAIVLERLRAGGFKSHGRVDDAITIGTIETGVAMRALDADRIEGRLGLRLAQPGESLGEGSQALELPDGTLVLADERRVLGLIFGETATDVEVSGKTERVAICAIQVQGVPEISVEEAIWNCVTAIAADRKGGQALV